MPGRATFRGEGNAVGMLEGRPSIPRRLSICPQAFMLALFSDGILETLPPKNLVEKEAFFLDVFCAYAPKPPDELVSERLGLDSAATAPDDIAAFFISKRSGND
jgi:sigma-B regulation protein RsbU (phosphoserine phosphatase)